MRFFEQRSIDRIINGMYWTNGSSTETHKIFWYITTYEGKFLKRIFTDFYFIKYNEINLCQLHVQKLVSYKNGNNEYKNSVCRFIQKISDTLCAYIGKILKKYFTKFTLHWMYWNKRINFFLTRACFVYRMTQYIY